MSPKHRRKKRRFITEREWTLYKEVGFPVSGMIAPKGELLVECGVCHQSVNSKNIKRHMRKVHGVSSPHIVDNQKSSHKPRSYPMSSYERQESGKKPFMTASYGMITRM